MKTALSLSAALLLVVGGFAIADNCANEKQTCPHGEKLTRLLGEWEAATADRGSACPVEQARIQATYASVTEACPVGSRIPDTLKFTRGVLAAAVSLDAGKACCGAEDSCSKPEACCGSEACKMLSARSHAARSLHQLVTYAVESLPECPKKSATSAGCAKDTQVAASVDSGCSKTQAASVASGEGCEKATKLATTGCAKDTQVAASVDSGCCAKTQAASVASGEGCEKATKLASAGCAKDTQVAAFCAETLTRKAVALKACWAKAPAELETLCPDKKKEVLASIDDLQKSSKVMALLPETVLATAEGIQALDKLNQDIIEYAKQHPEFAGKACEATRAKFLEQARLVHEAAEVLGSATRVMKDAMGAPTKPSVARGE